MGKIIVMQEDELEALLDKKFNQFLKNKDEKQPEQKNKVLHGIKELADFLGCSTTTAQKLKNSGKIPFTQFGRKIQMNSNEVLKALEKQKR